MDILIGALVAIATQLLKKLTSKIGKEWTLLVVFVLALIGTAVYRYAEFNLNADMLEGATTTFLTAIGTYELILKRLPFIGRSEE